MGYAPETTETDIKSSVSRYCVRRRLERPIEAGNRSTRNSTLLAPDPYDKTETPPGSELQIMAIPKTIYQTYKSAQLPLLTRWHISRMRRRNPEYDYQFYDDARIEYFIKEHYDAD